MCSNDSKDATHTALCSNVKTTFYKDDTPTAFMQ